jgi:hypothetical protein
VLADPRNIFRYSLRLSANGLLSIQIDDIAGKRHIPKEKQVDKLYVRQLAKSLEDAGFFTLAPTYEGLPPSDAYERYEISATIGRRTLASRVVNRLEPEVFKNVREMLELEGKKEFGLWAIQFSADKLTDMGRDAYLQGRKLLDEREVKYSNLAAAIQSFSEAESLVETIEPKPDFYADALTGRKDAKDLLNQKYEDRKFEAEQAIRLRKWKEAAEALRVLQELIPDRSDPRNQEARKELISVENSLKREK